jgi:hypothetical protein
MRKPIIIAIALFLELLFAVYFVLPQYRELNGLEEKIAKKETLVRQSREHLAKVKQSAQILKMYAEKVSKVKSALPEEVSSADILNFFQEEASTNGLILDSLRESREIETQKKEESAGSKQNKKARIKTTVFSLSMKGALYALVNFLKALESSARLFEVTRLNLISGKDGVLKIALTVKTHSY